MTQTPVAEIVTFRLKEGTDPQAFAKAAEALGPFLHGTGALLTRHLSCDPNGQWTDHITWRSLEAAKAAAAQMFEQPEAAPMMAMIDPDCVTMHHAPLALHWE